MDQEPIRTLAGILKASRTAERPLVFAISGNGLAAASAAKGGIQFLMALSAGIFRCSGVSSIAAFMPFGNANALTIRLIETQIRPRCPDLPLVAGFLCNDPHYPFEKYFSKLRSLGVGGIINWPPASMNNGKFMEAMKDRGFSIASETAMLREAKKNGLTTFGFASTSECARLFVQEAAPDALVLNAGWTIAETGPLNQQDHIQFAIKHVNEAMSEIGKTVNTERRPVCLFYGGGVTSPEYTLQLYQQTEVEGIGLGSALEYFPVSECISSLAMEFMNVNRRETLPQKLRERPTDLLGASKPMLTLYETVSKIAPWDVNICIQGESGSGKDLVANSLHALSRRAMGAMITVNCGAIPDSLAESEFFGHEKGAFTGAHEKRIGKFELANHGTLFLDEVAELSTRAQASLLRAIQQREIVRVGGHKNIPVDIRIICATNRNLEQLVETGAFRLDLFYRLCTIRISVPPLRERLSDLETLIRHILKECREKFGSKSKRVTPDFMARLKNHHWPGNVRELQHVLIAASILENSEVLAGYSFQPEKMTMSPTPLAQNSKDAFFYTENAKNEVIDALRKTEGNKSKAARMLGISRKTLYQKLKKYGLAEIE